jgi:hypothetical protein
MVATRPATKFEPGRCSVAHARSGGASGR